MSAIPEFPKQDPRPFKMWAYYDSVGLPGLVGTDRHSDAYQEVVVIPGLNHYNVKQLLDNLCSELDAVSNIPAEARQRMKGKLACALVMLTPPQ